MKHAASAPDREALPSLAGRPTRLRGVLLAALRPRASVLGFALTAALQGCMQALFVVCVAALLAPDASATLAWLRQQRPDVDPLLAVVVVALLASVIKGMAQAAASAIQSGFVAHTGELVRLALLADPRVGPKSLHSPGHEDHGGRPAQGEGTAATTVVSGVDDIERAVGEGAFPALRALTEIVPLLMVLVLVASRHALLGLLVLVPFVAWLAVSRRSLSRLVAAQLRARHRLLLRLDDAVRHAAVWRVHGVLGTMRGLLRGEGVQVRRLGERAAWLAELGSVQNEVLGVVFVLLSVWWRPQGESLAGMLRFFAVFFLLYRPLRTLTSARLGWERGERALQALPLDPDIDWRRVASRTEQPERAVWGPGTLCVDSLRTAHGASSSGVWSLEPGEMLLVLGPSGVGKTSLLLALLGLQPLRSGVLSYAGLPLEGVGVGLRARPFAWAPQHCPVVGQSLQQALFVDSLAVVPEHVLAVLGRLPEREGLEGLSGGEAQRINLARALLSTQPVLLLDEPTAHLDAAAADSVVAALRVEGERGRSLIVVSHDSARFAHADWVLHLDAHRPPRLSSSKALAS